VPSSGPACRDSARPGFGASAARVVVLAASPTGENPWPALALLSNGKTPHRFDRSRMRKMLTLRTSNTPIRSQIFVTRESRSGATIEVCT
jgi:hypothetical protein